MGSLPIHKSKSWQANSHSLGPFVRINPYEIHCIDPAFFDVLYVSGAKRRTDKWYWLIRQSYIPLLPELEDVRSEKRADGLATIPSRPANTTFTNNAALS